MIETLISLIVFVATLYTAAAVGFWAYAKMEWDIYGEYLEGTVDEAVARGPFGRQETIERRDKAIEAAYRMNNFWGTPIIALRQAMATKRDALRVAQEHDNKEGHAGS